MTPVDPSPGSAAGDLSDGPVGGLVAGVDVSAVRGRLERATPGPWVEDYAGEVNQGALLVAESARRRAWESVGRWAAAGLSSPADSEEEPLRCVHERPFDECDGPDAHTEPSSSPADEVTG